MTDASYQYTDMQKQNWMMWLADQNFTGKKNNSNIKKGK